MKTTKHKKSKVKPITHDQWIEITVEDGRTVTTFYPSNEDFEKERLDRDPQPNLVYRRFNFVHGVPGEYNWTVPDFNTRIYGGMLLQRMSIDDWQGVLSRESVLGNIVAVSCSTPLTRPEAFGPCPCSVCIARG